MAGAISAASLSNRYTFPPPYHAKFILTTHKWQNPYNTMDHPVDPKGMGGALPPDRYKGQRIRCKAILKSDHPNDAGREVRVGTQYLRMAYSGIIVRALLRRFLCPTIKRLLIPALFSSLRVMDRKVNAHTGIERWA